MKLRSVAFAVLAITCLFAAGSLLGPASPVGAASATCFETIEGEVCTDQACNAVSNVVYDATGKRLQCAE
jgi:hypothetical protein